MQTKSLFRKAYGLVSIRMKTFYATLLILITSITVQAQNDQQKIVFEIDPGDFIVPVKYSWPLKLKPGVSYPGYWAISNYVDEDPAEGTFIDYNGGTQTYDGHDGTDIRIYPYAWNKVKNNEVYVIAAADGVITKKKDGNEDSHCSWDQTGESNTIEIKHGDGTKTIYKHMKKNSLTSLSVGDSIFRGEYLGVVASSGHSDKPHLHFEVRSKDGNVIDPWKGTENPIFSSRWSSQLPYLPSGLNYIAISSEEPEPVSPACPNPEKTYEKSTFMQREIVHITTMIRHEKNGHIINYRLYKPDNTVWRSWQTTSSSTYTTRSHYKWHTLPDNAPVGTWRVEVDYQGQTYKKNFTVVLFRDCNGTVNGTAYRDECGTCVGGTTGKTTADSDQDGVVDCKDWCPLDPNKTSISQGTCICTAPSTPCINMCTNLPAYSANTFYVLGNEVKFLNKKYLCIKNTVNVPPSFDPEGPWAYNGICDGRFFLPPINIDFPISFKKIEASPNPVQNELTLLLQNVTGPVTITVYNFIGEELCSFPATEYGDKFTFPIEKLPAGLLLVQVQGEDFVETVRVKKE